MSDLVEAQAVAAGADAATAPALDPDTAAPTPRRRGRELVNLVGPALAFCVFVGFWYVMHYWALRAIWDKPDFLVPPPHTVINEAFVDTERLTEMLRATRFTAYISLIGLGIAILVGTILAVAMAQARWLERSAWPYLVALQAIPVIALTPLIGSIWGTGPVGRIVVCVLIAMFPIVANTLFGLLSADRGQHDLFTLRNASRSTRMFRLQFPAALPAIFAGYRIAAGLSVIGAIVGELFFRRGEKGIGILLADYRSQNQVPEAYGAMILTAALGIALFVAFGWLAQLIVGKWHESTRKTG